MFVYSHSFDTLTHQFSDARRKYSSGRRSRRIVIHLIASEQADTACTEQEVKERRRAMAMVHCSSPVKEFRFDCVSWPWPITAIHNKSPKCTHMSRKRYSLLYWIYKLQSSIFRPQTPRVFVNFERFERSA